MKGFSKKRPVSSYLAKELKVVAGDWGVLMASKPESGLPAISLNAHNTLISVVSNDIGGDFIYAQHMLMLL